jgi:hypothetical protein
MIRRKSGLIRSKTSGDHFVDGVGVTQPNPKQTYKLIEVTPSAVEPVTSAKTTVTVFRSSGAGWVPASAAPQSRQKFARSGFSLPHCPQIGTRTGYGKLHGRSSAIPASR